MSATSVLGYPSNPSIPHTSQFQFHYSSSQASSASSSSISSFFSTDANSFQSAASSVSSSFGYAHLESGCAAGVMTAGAGAIKNQHTQNTGHCKAKPVEVPLPVECRQNPRRTCNTVANGTTSGVAYAQRPPMLVRQCERKDSFVDGLVGKFCRQAHSLFNVPEGRRLIRFVLLSLFKIPPRKLLKQSGPCQSPV